jgi:hypothetical protein
MAAILNDIPKRMWKSVMTAAQKTFPPGNDYGVFGFGIGFQIVKGTRKEGRTLNAYIERKVKNPKHPIPEIVCTFNGKSYVIRPDVIATGRKPRTSASPIQTFSGLCPGSVIGCNDAPYREFGGVACILTIGYGPSHLITAGHLFPKNAVGNPVYAGHTDTNEPISCGELSVNLLDSIDENGTSIDAALVELNNAGRALAKDSNSGPNLYGFAKLTMGSTDNARAFLPNSNDYSNEVEIEYFPNVVYFSSDVRTGYYQVQNALRTSVAITNPGASGTILITANPPFKGLGSCIGEFQYHSFFEPFSRSYNVFRQTYPNLKLWR